jgi:hypothetical protein
MEPFRRESMMSFLITKYSPDDKTVKFRVEGSVYYFEGNFVVFYDSPRKDTAPTYAQKLSSLESIRGHSSLSRAERIPFRLSVWDKSKQSFTIFVYANTYYFQQDFVVFYDSPRRDNAPIYAHKLSSLESIGRSSPEDVMASDTVVE